MTEISEEDVIEASTAYMFTRGDERTKMRAAIELLVSRGWGKILETPVAEGEVEEAVKRLQEAAPYVNAFADQAMHVAVALLRRQAREIERLKAGLAAAQPYVAAFSTPACHNEGDKWCPVCGEPQREIAERTALSLNSVETREMKP